MCRRKSENLAQLITCLLACLDPIKQDGEDFNRKRKEARRTLSKGGRVPAFQAGCRGFEPRLPLHVVNRLSGRALEAVL